MASSPTPVPAKSCFTPPTDRYPPIPLEAVGVINLVDKAPPLFNLTRGYDTTVYNSLARGCSLTLQLGEKF